ncbi:molybdenum cofactor biosynthesis protein MoaE [Actinomadura bangladeshensis]|uniref:Molybdopterin synthase catalytic subunit 1 n=1 Tax=Actinomadura bangladeshensis TaxID=453573 RepID=A0A4R4P1U8_9ACTN|nr:molybdenum cofactor biosynthesis protein MoaE [Actinomadura bangladeshensis]TDC13902.1 molybdenum cofactor biosynthesis protein MoaE [Actinomadura bangladeshensis]
MSQSAAGGDVIRLIGVRETPLSIDEVYSAVGAPGAGGIAVFAGTVRDHDHARAVTGLAYSAHPTVERELRAVMEKVAADFPVLGLAALHRVGDLEIGDIAVVVAAACAHRAEAFAACRRLIDDLKANVPIWKHQTFADGDDEWVGAC